MTKNLIRDYWLERHTTRKDTELVTCPPVECVDGFKMSVQASYYHYCSPREYAPSGDYDLWEVGFPSEVEELLMDWPEDVDNPTDTVYGYVPTDIINQVIAKHGGIQNKAECHD